MELQWCLLTSEMRRNGVRMVDRSIPLKVRGLGIPGQNLELLPTIFMLPAHMLDVVVRTERCRERLNILRFAAFGLSNCGVFTAEVDAKEAVHRDHI